MTIPILFTFDDNLIMPAGVCITSLLENAGPDTFYDIFIIHSDKYDFSRSLLADIPKNYGNCKITFRTVHDEFSSAYEIRGITTTAYYRLLSPEIITEYDKILYSDVDVIFREDLTWAYELDIQDNHFAAVDNCSIFRESVKNYLTNKLKIDWRNGYYYSGNLVINLKQIREEKVIPRFRDLAKNNYHQQDMDIINIASNGRFYALPPAFCLTNYLYDLIVNNKDKMLRLFPEEELNHALSTGIVHYNGPKPWKQTCLNMDIWWDYYRRSIFFDQKTCFNVFDSLQNAEIRMPLKKRLKLLARYFIYGKK